jgi:O-antigen/teichoic acid export membrane protein
VTRAAFFVLAAAAGGTIRAVLYAAVAQGAVQLAALLLYLNSRFPGFWRAFDSSVLWRQLSYALPFAAGGLLYSLETDLHSYFVSKDFGASAYAVYAIGCFQLPLFAILAESVGAVMIPRCSALQHAQATREIVLLTARAMRKLSLMYFPAYAFLMVVRREFIVGLFTDRYVASVPIFALNLTLIPLGIFMFDPIVRAYAAHRHFPMKLHASLLLGLAIALPIAIARFGLIGAISAVVVVNVVSRAAGLMKIISILKVEARDIVLLTDVGKAAVAAAAAGLLTAVVRPLVSGVPPLATVAVCAVWFGAIYVVAALLLGVVAEGERKMALDVFRRATGGSVPRLPRRALPAQD